VVVLIAFDTAGLAPVKVALARSGDESTSSISMPGRSCDTRFSKLANRFSTLERYLSNA
jgi:hypothetical protein